MKWPDVRTAYPNRWLVVEAMEAHSDEGQRILDRIAVIETCTDGTAAMQCYNELHRQYPQREFYCVKTSRETLEILENRSVSMWREGGRGNLEHEAAKILEGTKREYREAWCPS